MTSVAAPSVPVAQNGLAELIDSKRVQIIADWESFAQSLGPAGDMTALSLRDHIDQILTAVIADMRTQQTLAEQAEKSKGRGVAQRLEPIGRIHAALRIEDGFRLGHLVAEYRALRASVLRLWQGNGSDPSGVTRFNEAIDEALTEAVSCYVRTTEHFRDQSLGILGHDLRNPLSAIIMGATLLVGSEHLDDKSVRVASRMLSSGQRMNRMIGDLLDLTRTRSGDRIPIVRQPIDLRPLCEQVVAELDGLLPAGTLQFAAEGDLRGEWDGDRIAQVLSNLVRNAIQHGPEGKPIRLTARDDGEAIVLSVESGGPAIEPRVLSHIFEPMVRRSGEHGAHAGLGLGLYIATQIALAHGGTLGVTSTDAGTAFTVQLPRRAPTTDRSSVRPAKPA